MANAFLDCRQIESESITILEQNKILSCVSKNMGGVYYDFVTDKLTQELFGDVRVHCPDGAHKFMELKAEVRHTGNLFVETWSNYSPQEEAAIYDKRQWKAPQIPHVIQKSDPERYERLKAGNEYGVVSRVGWLDKLDKTDVLIYHFLDENKAYVINWPALKNWLYEVDQNTGKMRMEGIWHAPMGKQVFKQKNRSWGLIVKISDIIAAGNIAVCFKLPKVTAEALA